MKKGTMLLISIFAIAILILIYRFTGADIVSVNSGGNSNITVTPDIYSEGFFSNPNLALSCSAQGGQICSSSQTCTGAIVGASDTLLCCLGSCTSPSPTPPPPGPPSSITSNISVIPSQFNLNMLVNTNLNETIYVTNNGGSAVTLSVTQTNLTNMILVENTTLTINPGETIGLFVIFIAPGTVGIYNGSINIGNVVVPVSLNVAKQFTLFDSNIIVLNKNSRVVQGQPLKTQVVMIPMGNNVRLDVTLNYVIKNMNGTIYSTRSETVLVTSTQSLLRNFDTGNLPVGNYTIGLNLVYPYGIAPSSAHFEVLPSQIGLLSEIYYWFIFIIIIIAVIIIILTTIRTQKKSVDVGEETMTTSV